MDGQFLDAARTEAERIYGRLANGANWGRVFVAGAAWQAAQRGRRRGSS